MATTPSNFTLPFIQGNPDEYVTHNGLLPSFVTFKFPDYSFLPVSLLDLGISVIEGQLWNPFTVTNFKIKLNVTNHPPYIPAGFIADQILINIDSIYNFLLPDGIDREG
jgi:hypothetical protein